MARTWILVLAVVGLVACDGFGSGIVGVGTSGGGGGSGSNANPLIATVTIANFAFTPATARIRPGGRVTWAWSLSDTTSHNVTFVTTSMVSNSSGTKNSGTHTVPFAQPGTYNYRCSLHPSMTGAVTVN